MIYYGIALTLLISLGLITRYGGQRLEGPIKVGKLSFFAILFTTGLDGGLLLLPLVDFSKYASATIHPAYTFTNPLAIEFGFWGCLSWLCYFVTTCYFSLFEPKLKVFRIFWVKWLNNALIILTCAFSAWLLYSTLPAYIPEHWLQDLPWLLAVVVFIAICSAVFSSANLVYIKWLSLISLALLVLLVLFIGNEVQLTGARVLQHTESLIQYFRWMEKFVLPLDAYHQFYMFWWLAWSIIIGQFTARFVDGYKVYQLCLAMLILPSIPIALWFIVLYDVFLLQFAYSETARLGIAFMGALFVINSMDSMIRLYTEELSLSPKQLGKKVYFSGHITLLILITVMYDVRMLNIEIVGSVILGLWTVALYYWLQTYRSNWLKSHEQNI